MKVTLESTSQIVELCTPDGDVPARIWEGTTEHGVAVIAFITRITPGTDQRNEQFEAELLKQRTPSEAARAIPARLVL